MLRRISWRKGAWKLKVLVAFMTHSIQVHLGHVLRRTLVISSLTLSIFQTNWRQRKTIIILDLLLAFGHNLHDLKRQTAFPGHIPPHLLLSHCLPLQPILNHPGQPLHLITRVPLHRHFWSLTRALGSTLPATPARYPLQHLRGPGHSAYALAEETRGPLGNCWTPLVEFTIVLHAWSFGIEL